MRKLHKASMIRLVSSMRSNEVSLSFSNQVSYSCLRDCRNLFLLCWDEEEMCAGTQSPSLSLLTLLQLRTSKGVLVKPSRRDPAWDLSCVYGYVPSFPSSNARAPVTQLVRASDWNSKDPGSNPAQISVSFFAAKITLQSIRSLHLMFWFEPWVVLVVFFCVIIYITLQLCMVSVKTLTILRLRCFLHQTGYQLPLCMCSHIKYVWLTPKR